MKFLRAFVVLFTSIVCVSCTNKEDSPPSVYGDWLYVNQADTAGIGLTVRENGTYTVMMLALTSETTGQAQVENGTVMVAPDALTFTTTESTCPDATAETVTYKCSLRDDQLGVLFPEGLISLKRNTAKSESSFIIAFGCRRNGKFTESSLAPVQ